MTGTNQSLPPIASPEDGRSALSPAPPPSAENLSSRLATELLDAVDSGSSAALLEVLSRITLVDVDPGAGGGDLADSAEWERLELLRAIAVQLRLDLHAMLMHIYQRLETSRGYLDVVRNLAGRPAGGAGLCGALPRVSGNGEWP